MARKKEKKETRQTYERPERHEELRLREWREQRGRNEETSTCRQMDRQMSEEKRKRNTSSELGKDYVQSMMKPKLSIDMLPQYFLLTKPLAVVRSV
jgi:hypothetical protein